MIMSMSIRRIATASRLWSINAAPALVACDWQGSAAQNNQLAQQQQHSLSLDSTTHRLAD